MTGYRFEPRAARYTMDFIQRFCRHSIGEWAGRPFLLQPWQADHIVAPLFGWLRPDGSRRYRTAYIEIPRKNGKSSLAAALALRLLFADGEAGGQVYSAAADRLQAAIVFEQAKAMIKASPALLKRAKIFKHHVEVPATGSVYRVLSADAYTKDGLNASGIVFDELHAQRTRDLWDVLSTSTGSRRQPLLIAITTAGYDRQSICWQMHQLSRATLQDESVQPSHFAYIASANETDNWTDPDVWRKANPGYGVTVREDYLQEKAREAEQQPGFQNAFKRLHLNIWTQQETRWLDMAAWEACREPEPVALEGRPCYAGLDLASTNDLASFCLCFPPAVAGEPYRFRWWFWVPGNSVFERERRDRVPYVQWMQQGLIEATPGEVIDFDAILARVTQLGKTYRIREIAFDRWGATRIQAQLQERRFTMVQFGQGYASMASPTAALGRMVKAREVAHDGNAVAYWNADNLVVVQDEAGNLKPAKNRSREKIDGMVAAIMALSRALLDDKRASAYETRGALVL